MGKLRNCADYAFVQRYFTHGGDRRFFVPRDRVQRFGYSAWSQGIARTHLPVAADRHAAWNPTDQRFRLQEDLRHGGEPRRLDQPAQRDPPAGIADRRGYAGKPLQPAGFPGRQTVGSRHQGGRPQRGDLRHRDATDDLRGPGAADRLLWLRALRRPAQGGRGVRDPQSGLYDLAGQWHPLAGRDPGPPCLSPGRRRIGAGFGGNIGDSHAGTGEV